MKKIIAIILTFLFITNCGFTPIYSGKNFDFKLKDIITINDSQLSSKVQRRLKKISKEESKKIISIKIDTQKKINILSKNSKGDPSRYEMIIDIKLNTTYAQNKNMSKSFQEKFNYNANANKFELNQYQQEIEDLLINQNIERIIIYLSKF